MLVVGLLEALINYVGMWHNTAYCVTDFIALLLRLLGN